MVEKECPAVVSCADILALATRDSVVYLGGPSWEVGLRRRDSTTASRLDANNSIPTPSFSLSTLKQNFANQGLSEKDLVALSDFHNRGTYQYTIDLAQCRLFGPHIYNDTNIDASYAKFLQSKCPRTGNDKLLELLHRQTPFHFDNLYYKNLVQKKVLFHSDQKLYTGDSTDHLVGKYATDRVAIF
ncbi:hypothetical protein Ahy_A02g006370 [Arachis hypogaea]|uniref:peroxidase n=1 Tax=Arachis hypogaea TaxID=3818 RepID=A0A445E9K7_ARAHY|nr:hypothetical protein Ahy_A02g006370 [Arachis hypogaea]